MADNKDEIIDAVARTVFAWMRNEADPDGKVEILRGEVGAASETLAIYLITELADQVEKLGWPIKVEAQSNVDVSIRIED